jgi:xylulokinase
VGHIASALFGRPVLIPPAGEYVADGAARQAAWALHGTPSAPVWNLGKATLIQSEATPHVLEQYRILRDATVNW